ncbi:agouti-related protein-like isoform X2 [Anguilla rostrata]|uniref:agouti-related protein-like isoform X2 n=1 Tax=Anguilla rostrata TaxID=7938 RepID=UPI0030CA6617
MSTNPSHSFGPRVRCLPLQRSLKKAAKTPLWKRHLNKIHSASTRPRNPRQADQIHVSMWSSLVLGWWVLCGTQALAGAVHGSGRPQETPSSLLMSGKESPFLSSIGGGPYHRLGPERFVIESEELLVEDTGLYNEAEDVSELLPLQSRSVRSPRRCFRHGESCLGHQLPCCDACDTCYCRFFNAICYCRSIGQACSHGRH